MFRLDQTLENDSHKVASLDFCELLLVDNSEFPWLILVPRQKDLVELTDLNFDDQVKLLKEVNQVSNVLQKKFSPDKINIAALGNVVKQLHIHVIARFKSDKAFPSPVWGVEGEKYSQEELKKLIQEIKEIL